MLQSFPLLALSLGVFWLFNIASSGAISPWYEAEAFSIRLLSHDTWHISCGDAFLLGSMILLFVEVVRSTRSDGKSITNHALSVLVFVAAFMLFLTRPGYGNSAFCIFMSMTLLDFMAGFIITAVAARRDISFKRLEH